jgi:hypothetical protein
VAAFHLCQQMTDLLRRILQVGVQSYDALAAYMREARHDRHVLSEIAVEQHHARLYGTALELLSQQRSRAIGRAIVHEDDFIANVELIQGQVKALEQMRQALLFVVDRDDDGEIEWVHQRSMLLAV